jgi:hypothetical protein
MTNRQQRRAAQRQQRQHRKHVKFEHGGAMHVQIIRRETLNARPDEHITQPLALWLNRLKHHNENSRPLCLNCEYEFHEQQLPDGFSLVTPFAANSRQSIVTGICPRCAQLDDETLSRVVLRRLQKYDPALASCCAGRA